MIFLFEQFTYSLDYLKKVLPTDSAGRFKGLPNGFVTRDCKLDGVGYLFNGNPTKKETQKADISDRIVFVLPKVFLDENGTKAFGKDIPNAENFKIDAEPKEFLSQLSLWVCSSIGQYRLTNPNDKDIDAPDAPDAHRFSSSKLAPTLIDVMNAMKLFYAENRNLFVFTAKNKHSGNNRIDWRRTVAHTQPFMQGDTPIYMELENKKKVFDLDDRLLVLYFSAMNYIEETFGFKMPKSEFYTPIRMNEFRRLLGHRGLVELRRIKHKYFADRFLKLYNIVKAFFEWGGTFSANDFESEYLLTSKYNNVFEAMIDKLVGDDGKSINSLKHNDDGKIIDHLYKEPSLIFASGDTEKIWHIGDSKYYQDPEDIRGKSLAKQFTYAKNVIQDFFSPEFVEGIKKHDADEHRGVRYRDSLTEGYSVTPNFFIRGELPKYENTEQFNEPYFRATENINDDLIQLARMGNGNKKEAEKEMMEHLWNLRNRHFANRLFDRDTLLLQTYDVNFLYVLKAYTSKRSSLREEFKRTAREKFRKNFLDLLDKKYVFYAVWPKASEKDFVDAHFRMLAGKIFKPAGLGCLILALEQDSTNDSDVISMWDEIEKECEMIARVTPREIWNDGSDELEEATFNTVFYNERMHGFFVDGAEFKKAEIGKKSKLPKYLMGKPMEGSAYVKIGFPPADFNLTKKDDFYFLPCKGNT